MSTIKSSTTLTTAYSVEADTTGTLVIQTGATPTTAVTVDASQNVGIGTASPAKLLEVKSTTTNLARMRVTGTGTTANNYRGYEFASASGFTGGIFQDESTSNLQFWGNSNALMTLNSSGNVGIGVVPSAWNTFSVIESGRSGNCFFGQTGASQTGIGTNAYYSSAWKYANTGVSTLYYQLSGVHTFAGAASGTAGNSITFSQLLAFSNTKTVALEGASSVAGTGISFPSTQSASSDANTLDDYEEGTWTPATGGGTGTVANYTKIGRMVYVYGDSIFTGISSPASQITGLPFVVGSLQTAMTISFQTVSASPIGGVMVIGTSRIDIYNLVSTAITVGNSTRILFSAAYQI
jgi:hypothetical protein